jgi:DNA polymerase III gamma/tau subunit
MNERGVTTSSTSTRSSISIIKLSSQVKKIVKELFIVENSSENIASVVSSLYLKHSEYQSSSVSEVTDTVKEIFNSIFRIPSTPCSPSPSSSFIDLSETQRLASMNLNQSLMNNQKSLASKRQRPEEVSSSLSRNNSSVSLSTTKGQEPTEKKADQLQKDKKRLKPTTLENDIIPSSSFKINKPANSFLTERPKTRFSDFAGMDSVISQIKELVCFPLFYPNLYAHLGVCPPCGILLHGPSGCGKTSLANAIAGETGLNFFKVRFVPRFDFSHVYLLGFWP